jgi:tetratricopeptide (TPR) repeat protein
MARFEAERQALAMMDHPNIAKVLDAGATDAGRPYFVMELVRGIKITDYCDQQRLSTRQRLDLFVQVCQAVQHAHQKGIIHRDLKPSNILVTEQDGKAAPKIIDFGIAKATTSAPLTDKTLFTAFDQFIGTPAYMSPEQAGLGGLDIDTRSDVYSLGVLLYELLTGKQPFDSAALRRSAIDEILRIIREQEPPRPSASLTTFTEQELTLVAQRHQSEPAKFSNLLRGDLDWIVMKTLEKDRARRYETANGLTADILRHLKNEPVTARPPTPLYRFQKSVRRNKFAFGALAAVLAGLIFGLGIAYWQFVEKSRAYNRAVAAETQAKAEAAKSQQVAKFLEDMLNGMDPDVAKNRDTTLLREILESSAERISHELVNQPDVQAQLENTIGNVYCGFGEYTKSELMHSNALANRKALYGNEHPAVAESLCWLATDLYAQDKLGEAENLARKSLVMRKKLLGNEHEEVADSLNILGLVFARKGQPVEAERLFRESLAIQRRLFGEEHLSVAHSLTYLAKVLLDQGRFAECEAATRAYMATFQKLVGEDNPMAARGFQTLANCLEKQGKLLQAEDSFRHVLAIRRKNLGNENLETAVAMSGLGRVLLDKGKFGEAESMYRECLVIREKSIPDAWFTFYTRSLLGETLLGQKKFIEAEPLLLSGYEGMKKRAEKIQDRSKVLPEAVQRVIQLYEATGQSDKAADWKMKLAELDKAEAGKKTAPAQ